MEILENQLIVAVSLKDKEKALKLLDSITKNISDETSSFEYFRYYIIQFNGIFYWNTIKNISDFKFTNSILKERNKFLVNILNSNDKASLCKVFTKMINFYTASQNDLIYNCEHPTIKTVLIYSYNNSDQKISLEILSNKFHISKSYLSNLISKHTGKSLPAILLEFRMDKARAMLLDSNLSINDIAKSCGFDSTSYFCHQFKSIFNTTPKHYRSSSYKNI